MQLCLPRLIAVKFPRFHQLLELLRAVLVHQLAPLHTIGGNHRVAVADGSDMPGVFPNRLADLTREIRQVSHRGILLENDLSVLLRIDLQRVAVTEPIDSKIAVLRLIFAFYKQFELFGRVLSRSLNNGRRFVNFVCFANA